MFGLCEMKQLHCLCFLFVQLLLLHDCIIRRSIFEYSDSLHYSLQYV